MLSQREVARSWGVSRASIQRAIKSGKMSVLADGSLDPSEVVRVFGEPSSRPIDRPTDPDEAAKSHPKSHEIAALRAALAAKDDLLFEKDARIDDLRNALRLLTDQRPPPTNSAKTGSSSLWAWITGR